MTKQKANRFRFRCWSPYGKIMLTEEESAMPHLRADGTLHIEYDSIDVTDNLILMQSTGLLDSKGVEIFEGDIIQYEDNFLGKMCVVIEWKNWCWHLPYSPPFCEHVEVIGNIYQNPELLEEKCKP